MDALLQRGQRITGLATHYTDLDEMTSGLQRSDLIIIAARPSMGKTAFAMNIAENASIEDQKVVGVFSLEMSREALLLRLLCSQARVDSHKMRTGSLWQDDMNKVDARHGATGARPDFHRRHARHRAERNARQGAAAAAGARQARPAHRGLPAADVRAAASAMRTAPRKFRPFRAG